MQAETQGEAAKATSRTEVTAEICVRRQPGPAQVILLFVEFLKIYTIHKYFFNFKIFEQHVNLELKAKASPRPRLLSFIPMPSPILFSLFYSPMALSMVWVYPSRIYRSTFVHLWIYICSMFVEKITRSGIGGLKGMHTFILTETERVRVRSCLPATMEVLKYIDLFAYSCTNKKYCSKRPSCIVSCDVCWDKPLFIIPFQNSLNYFFTLSLSDKVCLKNSDF